MNKQTAVQWLIDHIKNPDGLPYSTPEELFEMALQMEKQQIIQTYHKSALNEATHIVAGTSHISAEQYYNKTFKSE